ncbi:MAG: hypothetical protein EP343_25705 [Deltaproteobacteria bacterium]|nr:MAG: hypothetical protein EP343_25705 [Deltaproteobacteria bacterium]
MKRTKKVKAVTDRVPSISYLENLLQDLNSGVVQLFREKHEMGLCLESDLTPSDCASQKVRKEKLTFSQQWNPPAMEPSSP